MKEYITRFGHGSAKLACQAQSKEKILAKIERGGLTEKVSCDKVLVFRFMDMGKLPPPILQFVDISFGYTAECLIYEHIEFGVDLDSHVALVGPNGTGKSTLLKLMTGDLHPLDGMVKRHNHLKIVQLPPAPGGAAQPGHVRPAVHDEGVPGERGGEDINALQSVIPWATTEGPFCSV